MMRRRCHYDETPRASPQSTRVLLFFNCFLHAATDRLERRNNRLNDRIYPPTRKNLIVPPSRNNKTNKSKERDTHTRTTTTTTTKITLYKPNKMGRRPIFFAPLGRIGRGRGERLAEIAALRAVHDNGVGLLRE